MPANDPSSPLPRRRVRVDLLMLAACVLLFALVPTLDLKVASLMHDPAIGFRWANEPLVLLSYQVFKAKHIGWVAIALVVYLLVTQFRTHANAGRRKAALFLLALIVAGPVLLVNSGLKDNWGRARPMEVTQFGGERSYTPPLVPAMQCDTNCSFVSGHAAAAFVLTGMYWITRRRRWLVAGIALGGAVGLGRMLQGGHFLSDIVFAFWAVYLAGLVLDWLMLKERRTEPGNAVNTENP